MGFGSFFVNCGLLEIAGRSQLKDLEDPLFKGDREKVAQELRRICYQTMNVAIPIFKQKADAILERIADTFPMRIKAMESSLDQARKCAKITFLIAGKWHLMQSERPEPRYSLATFYEFLKKRHVIVLMPKKEITENIDEKTNATIVQYFPKTTPNVGE